MLKHIADAPVFSWPSRLLTTSDELFKNIVARMVQRGMMDKAIAESGFEFGKNAAIDRAFERLLKSEYSITSLKEAQSSTRTC